MDDENTALPDPLPLFPLQLVLFPGSRLHLKVFEPRYVDLVSECLREQRPFGVVCLRAGHEVGRQDVAFETLGTLSHIDAVDAEQPGLLHLRCIGGLRFTMAGAAHQQADGLWLCRAQAIAADPPQAPAAPMLATVTALAEAIRKLQEQGQLPFAPPFRLDEAGWVANRWCELLPIPLAAKQKLMALEDPALRLAIVDGFLRDKGVVGG
ncbi:MAG: LON peptidase substrate-binding domain-containing protein [Burkholderiales bacterium]|nr:LON peptidase substrate-binding domain-containing protein [Burkholderiales bacterium]MDE1929783.1 LON peptidase substrate-binding domain-containing protein [Burkholderiales bacterium]MDE2505367.1 LON peptidase substrate-binding domain-containing protein [Burkholderiales bacterium]